MPVLFIAPLCLHTFPNQAALRTVTAVEALIACLPSRGLEESNILFRLNEK